MAILNIGSFNTFIAKVKSHNQARKNEFTYDHTFNRVHYKYDKSRFFLEDKLNLLDEAREWFYEQGKDGKSGKVYVWLPDGSKPAEGSLRGKKQTYAFTVTN